MKKKDIISFAFGNFFRRKTRSALTVLGVVIGTAAVIIMLSIGIGMNKGYEASISQWGDLREIQIYKKWSMPDDPNASSIVGVMDDKSFSQIKQIEHVAAATPMKQTGYSLISGKTKSQPSIVGISAADMVDFDYKILKGRLLDETDVGTKNFVMVYDVPFTFTGLKDDYNWNAEVLPDAQWPFDPLEAHYGFTWQWDYGNGPVDTSKPKIKLTDANCVGILVQDKNNYGWCDNTIYMDVMGVIDMSDKFQKEQNKYYQDMNNNPDDIDSMLYYSGKNYDGNTNTNGRKDIYDQFLVRVDDTENVTSVESQIRDLGFETSSSMTYLNEMKSQSAFLRGILGAIGVVAFIVAALSIMNTMIMSIYERTREIGIMKVIGCKISDIRKMFLVEAGIIGFFGGIIGIGLSYISSFVVNKLALKSGGLLGYQVDGAKASIIPVWLILAGLALATVVGVLSGLYPAVRATRLSALDAIKNE